MSRYVHTTNGSAAGGLSAEYPEDSAAVSANAAADDADAYDELDGDGSDPIAVCGFSLKFPQEAVSANAFWEMLLERRCASTDFPANRLNIEGFRRDRKTTNTIPVKGGHFIAEDLSAFDASFFSISRAEASSIDPMQRWLLETAYRALENAGIPMETVSGSTTSVFTGCFGSDYTLQTYRDAETLPTYSATGIGLSMLANRISWFFNLRGPSITMDSACSSSLMALDVACQSLRSGTSNMSLVAGSNLTFAPEIFTVLTNASFLSPDGKCFSFDERGNGYARGEGIAVVVLKRLSDAIRDGNTIRAVIRSSCSNEDGRTPGITQPSSRAQKDLIEATYRRAKLSMAHTRYVEAHGTGTAIGDPNEAHAIGSSFKNYRSSTEPMYIGSVKSNIGHLEGASGLAGIIKTILAIEKGIIPPNTNFEKLNHRIDAEKLKITFPQTPRPWPTDGIRRASVNSFGYGGANSHVVLDDAYNYMRVRGISGKHCTRVAPERSETRPRKRRKLSTDDDDIKLCVWSAADKDGLARIAKGFEAYVKEDQIHAQSQLQFMADLAHTLGNHRSHLPWRAYTLIRSSQDLASLGTKLSPPQRASSEPPRVAFVFTGQGAQWFAMGRELTQYPSFQAELNRAGKYLQRLGCTWSVPDELQRSKETSRVDDPELSQTLVTVVQVALVNLIRRMGLRPSAVVGHSSGEIAAAFAGGYISSESAWKLAYCRGLCAAEAIQAQSLGPRGAMMAVGLSEADANAVIENIKDGAESFGIRVACINSPDNVTIAGEEPLIDRFNSCLDGEIFARKLKVGVAYHSGQMESICARYEAMIGSLEDSRDFEQVPMISSVTGDKIPKSRLMEASYWSLNMASPVQFSQAITTLCSFPKESSMHNGQEDPETNFGVSHILEIGPHGALQGPIKSITRDCAPGTSIGYSSLLKRFTAANVTLLEALGHFHCIGCSLNFDAINQASDDRSHSPSLLVDLPEYPFDHNQHYWAEGRLSRNYRLRSHPPSELLGVRARDWDPAEPKWDHFIRTGEMTWTEQHVIDGRCLYPAAGMLAMAIEAVKQISTSPNSISGYSLRNIEIGAPMDLTLHQGVLESRTSLRLIPGSQDKQSSYEFSISTYTKNDEWIINCQGIISPEHLKEEDWASSMTMAARKKVTENCLSIISSCDGSVDSTHMYKVLKNHGLEYGPLFQGAQNQRCCPKRNQASADITLFKGMTEDHVIHPATLDTLFHLVFTAVTEGGNKPLATGVPYRIGTLWVADQGLSWPKQEAISACTAVTKTTKRGFFCQGGALDNKADSHQLKVWFQDVEIRNISSDLTVGSAPSSSEEFCMQVECKPSLKHLSNEEVMFAVDPGGEQGADFYTDHELQRMIMISLKWLLVRVSPHSCTEPWKKHYLDWARHHINMRSQDWDINSLDAADLPHMLEPLWARVEKKGHAGALFAEISRRLINIFIQGDAPFDMIAETGLLKSYYEEVAQSRSAKMASRYIDLLAHEIPGLNILEVGGGTGSGARNIIKTLHSRSGGPLRCNRYDFTDISPTFLETAREEFKDSESQMAFRTLDIEKDVVDQGFEEGHYDVVLAISALHITNNLKASLRNIRRALKAGGQLILQESFEPSGWTLGFAFGLFPGWWAGAHDGRLLSPNIDTCQWDEILKQCGFSGVDMLLKDNDGIRPQHGWIVATAIESAPRPSIKQPSITRATIIIERESCAQHNIAYALANQMDGLFGDSSTVINIDELGEQDTGHTDELVVFLADYGPSFLESLDESRWASLQHLAQNSNHLLWISAGGGENAQPGTGLLDGLSRTLRSEHYNLHLVTLGLKLASCSKSRISHVMNVAREMVSRTPHQPYEQEYIEISGALHTRRLVSTPHIVSKIESRLSPYQYAMTPLSQSPRVEASMSGSRAEYIPCYRAVHDSSFSRLEENEVEIAVRAVTIQAQDNAAALGYTETTSFGRFFTGQVHLAGPDSGFTAGDRVFAIHQGALRSHVKLSKMVATLPDDLSFVDACLAIPPAVVAHQLVNTGPLEASDSALVHGASGSLGYAVLALLKSRGVYDIWATAADANEASWLTGNLGIPPKRIIPKTWLEGDAMLTATYKSKFDLVLSTDEATTPTLLVSCVQPGGRCVILRKDTQTKPARKISSSVPANVSLTVVDPSDVYLRPKDLQAIVSIANSFAGDLARDGKVLKASEIEAAFQQIRKDQDQNVVLTFEESDTIEVVSDNKSAYILDSTASFLVVGAFGGIGITTTRWLASRGAQHLILLSRSGPRSQEAQDMLNDLDNRGIRFKAPQCDVTDRNQLHAVLDNCATTMPPVKGTVLAAVSMAEGIFEKMTLEEWRTIVDSKATAAWNLHSELPKGLDFFVMTSSAMGWLGTASLAGYNAGNTYQEALARYRASQGQQGVSLNLGGILHSGFLADNKDRGDLIANDKKLYMMTMDQVTAILDIYCDPNNTHLLQDTNACQPIFGILPPAYWKHHTEVPHTMAQPLWGHMHHIPVTGGLDEAEGGEFVRRKRALDTASRLAATNSLEEAAEVASEALMLRLSALLGIEEDCLDVHQPMYSYGIDSLTAIYLRNWITKVFGVEMPVFEILGGASFASAGTSIAKNIHAKDAA